jgi:hypothetical protein
VTDDRRGRRVDRPVTEPTENDPADQGRTDEDREISDVGLPGPGDGTPTGDEEPADEAALDEVFPAADDRS